MVEELYKRKLIDRIVPLLKTPDIIVIHGARQVGKSSLLKYLINHHIGGGNFYMDLEFLEYLDLCNKGAKDLVKFLNEKGFDTNKKMFLLIDEIQYLDNPTNLLKLLHDHYPQIKLIVSGSSSFDIKNKFKESLVGRTIDFELYPLDFEEFLYFKKKNYKLGKKNNEGINKELLKLFEEYNFYGGYPRVALESVRETKKLLISQIIQTYIKKDIRDLGNIRNISLFNKLLEILASQSGGLINIEELSNTLNINKETLNKWIFLLEATYIIKIVRPYHKNIRSELTKNPKVFFLDTGLMHILHLKDFPKVMLGSSFETSVFSELIKNNHLPFFWRTTNKQEIDFVLKENSKIVAIESKINFQASISRSLEFFKEKYNSKNFIVSILGEKDKTNKKYPWEMIKELE